MALQPDEVGLSPERDDRFLRAQVEQFEESIDRQLRSHPAGTPFRTRLAWTGGVDPIAHRLSEKYRKAGWRRVVVEPEGSDSCWLLLEP